MNRLDFTISIMQSLFDPEIRRAIRNNPSQYAIDMGLVTADTDTQFTVVVSTANTTYIPLARHEDSNLSFDDLQAVQAAGTSATASTMGTLTTASTVSSLSGTLACLGTAGTVGCTGSAE